MNEFTVVLLAAVATAGLCPWLIGFLQRHAMVDAENGRTSHQGLVPRGGGLAMLFGVSLALLVSRAAWVDERYLFVGALYALAFGILGLADDIRAIPALVRLAVQISLSLAFVFTSGIRPMVTVTLFGTIATAAWITAFVNAFNFMDGINGISAATTIIIGSSLAITSHRWDGGVAIPAMALVGAAIGFAPFNAFSGRVFLGDVGSYLLGAALSLLAVIAIANGTPAAAVVLPFGLYIADVASTLAKRAFRGERLVKSHREHVYQRLTNVVGYTHLQATSIVAAGTLALGALGQMASGATASLQLLATLCAFAIAALYLTLPRLLESSA